MSIQQRRRLGQLADRIELNETLRVVDREYVVGTLRQLSEEADANEVFGLTNGKGEKTIDQIKRKNLAALFHWMMGAMEKLPHGYGLNATEAIFAASALSNNETYRCAKKNLVLEPGTPNLFKPVSPENLRKAWYKKDYQHLKKIEIDVGDRDFPY